MDLRSCSSKHFIQTIKCGLLIKVSNISHGRPVVRFKCLRDVYGSEDAKRQQKPPSASVKQKAPCSMVADRTLCKIKPEPDDFAPSADDYSDSDLDDSTTLSQLKNLVLTKKRKYVSTDWNSKPDYADVKSVKDESDLYEPLINLKPKHSKVTRAKRRCLNRSVVPSATFVVAIKSEVNLVSEIPPQIGGDVAPVIRVKTEVPDAEQLGSQIEFPSASSAGHNEVLVPGQKINEFGREPLLYANECEECVTNEISYDHLDDIQPITVLLPVDEASKKLLTLGSALDESLGSSPVEITKQKEMTDSLYSITSGSDDPNADINCHSSSSLVDEYMPKECSSGCHVPDMAIDGCMRPFQESNCILSEDKAEAKFPLELNDSPSSPGVNCGSNMGSITTSSTKGNPIYMKNDTIADEDQLSTSSSDNIMRNELNSEGHAEDELLKALDKPNSSLPLMCAENEYSLEEINCDNVETISTPEQPQLPERLFSTRKAFSPSSQERLCLAMNSVGIWNDYDQNIDPECKGKVLENQTRKKTSSLRPEGQSDKKTVIHRLPGQASQRKVVISPRRAIKRSQMAKGNLEGPRFSRTLPNLNTGCTSVQGCSESAVAFSQRQMHDMESIAVKLMNELKSMKDIVEQKLLFEAYRNASLKNDADEVKSSINSATKAEEMARKWMSMMARDCNRFCKIMKMMPETASSPKDATPKGKRKIVFADEAGGRLCHVKFLDDDTASPASDAVEEINHQI